MYRCILIDFILHACFAWLLWNVAVSTAHVVYVMCGFVRVLQTVPIQWNHLEMLTVQENFRQTQIKSFHWNEYEYRVMNIKTNAYDYYKGLHVSAQKPALCGNRRIDIKCSKRNKKIKIRIIINRMRNSFQKVCICHRLHSPLNSYLHLFCIKFAQRINWDWTRWNHISHIFHTHSVVALKSE